MLALARRWLPWVLLFAAFGLAVLVRNSSSSFRQCAAKQTKVSQHPQEKGSTNILVSLGHTGQIGWICTGEFLDQNNEAIAAGATVFIAIFTITLWRATTEQARLTRDSIQLARDEFNATHRPKIIVHAVELAFDVPLNGDDYDKATLGASIAYVNKGDTPAILTSISAKISQYTLPLPAGLGTGIGVELSRLKVPEGEIIPGVMEYCSVTSLYTENGARLAAHQAHGRGQLGALVLIGKINYRDRRGVSRQTGFCRRLDLGDFPFKTKDPRWVPLEGHPEYEYAY